MSTMMFESTWEMRMILVKRKFYGDEYYTEIPVYTIEEAKAKGLEFIYWRDAKHHKAGEWVSTDDGYVCQILKDATAFLYTTISLTSWKSRKPLSAETRIRNRSFSTFSEKDRISLDAGSARFKFVLRAVAVANLEGRKPDWERLGKVMNPHAKIPEASAKYLFKYRKVQDMLKQETQKIFEEQGLTESAVATAMKEAFELARTQKSPKVLLEFARDLADLWEMKPNRGKSQLQLPAFDAMGPLEDPSILKMVEEAKQVMAETGNEQKELVDPGTGSEYMDPAELLK